ncbi:MAG: PAS domain S-box protein [Ignavibacteria bacterium]|nr:PAS domain S-box protein [Ignavibacteria bacterium]
MQIPETIIEKREFTYFGFSLLKSKHILLPGLLFILFLLCTLLPALINIKPGSSEFYLLLGIAILSAAALMLSVYNNLFEPLRKHQEFEMHARQLLKMCEITNTAGVLTSTSGIIYSANIQFARLVHAASDDLAQKHLELFFTQIPEPEFNPDSFADKQPKQIELERNNGSKVKCDIMPLYLDSDQAAMYMLTFNAEGWHLRSAPHADILLERFKIAKTAGQLAVWDWDVKQDILIWDDMMYKLYGVKPSLFSGIHAAWVNALHPDDREYCENLINAALAGEKQYDTEFRVIHTDNSLHYIKAYGNVIRDANSKPVRMVGVNYDITEQRQLEEALLESRMWLQSILTALASGVIIIDAATHKIVDINPVGLEMIGAGRDEVVGQICHRFICPREIGACPVTDLHEHMNMSDKVLLRYNGDSIPILKSVSQQEINGHTYLIESIIDISERKKLEQELLQSKTNLDTFFNTIEDMVLVIRPDGTIIECNDTTLRKLRYSRDEMLNANFLSLYPSAYQQEGLSLISSLLEGDEETTSIPVINAKHVFIPVETRAVAGNWNGKEAIFIVIKDITKLRLSEEMFSSAFHSVSTIMTISQGSSGRILNINQAFIKKLGYSRDEVIGKTAIDLNLFPNANLLQNLKDLSSSGSPIVNLEVEVQCKDRSVIIGLFSADRIQVGITQCWLTSMIDITDLKTAEEALRKSELKYRRIFENVQDVFYQTDMNGIITDISPSIQRYSDYPADSLIGKPVHQVYAHPEERQKLLEVLKEQGEVIDYEIVLRRKSGVEVMTSVNAHFMFDSHGTPVGVEGSLRDISYRKAAELKLKQYADELQSLNESKDKFFSIISHDLRGPFASILSVTEMIAKDINIFTPEQLQSISIDLYKSVKNQNQLLEDLLQWSRLGSGRMPFRPELLICLHQISLAIDLLNHSASQKNISIRIDCADDVLIYADGNMLQMVLRNLLANAIKFSYENSTVTILAKTTETGTYISVSDNGIGIPQEALTKLFRIDIHYTQLGTREEKGTGLGLVLCRDIVTKHGGELSVNSEAGRGSTFYFTLPALVQ